MDATLFSDDLALNLKGEYRDLIGDGASHLDAKTARVQRHRASLDDPDDGTVA